MLKKIKKAIDEFNMISEGETVLCCLSGGADSVTLLLCLRSLGYNVTACHVNHCLRGSESDRDQEFCRRLCERLGVPLEIRRVDVKSFCKENQLSTEEGARILRYRIFEELRADKIATAHTLSDSFETAIFNLTRGSGLKGLCGIPPVRGNIVRPLIYCTRRDIEDYLAGQGEEWVNDSTNAENNYSRNKIRNLVIPVLEEINSSAAETFGNTFRLLMQEEAFLRSKGRELLESSLDGKTGYNAEVLSSADDPLLNRAVIEILSENGISYSADRIGEVAEIVRSGGRVNLSGNKYAVCSQKRLRITDHQPGVNNEICIKAEINCGYEFSGRLVEICVKEISGDDENVHKKFANYLADHDKIKGDILLRTRRNGDRIRLSGREHTSSLKKLLQASVPEEERGKIVMLADDEGLFFVEGFGVAERVSPDENTKLLLLCIIS